jgi:tRNA pseudouridine55 synthase
LEGILPIWKEKGLTSHDVVYRVRKLLKMKKVGHTGTLDPDVTGVLPICLGRATKIAEYITNAGKEYVGEVTLGFSTTTEDASGEVVEQKRIERILTRDEIEEVLRSLKGNIQQTPPMYSAVKVNGKRLYEYAREGKEVERPTRTVTIYDLDLLDERMSFSGDTIKFRFRVSCSKGTYIRTLAVMIGERLGYPAHMSDLVRTQSAFFRKEHCVTLEQLEHLVQEGDIHRLVFSIEKGLYHLPKIEINDTLAKKVVNGSVLSKPKQWPHDEEDVVVMHQGRALALYRLHPSKPYLIKPTKVLRNE